MKDELALVGPGEEERVAHMMRIVSERADIQGLTVLDLACRTGAFSNALAEAGAQVLGVEGRPSNFDHIPQSSTARFELNDVRNVKADTHGQFDVTLCMGILYHLGPEDAIALLAEMRRMTKRFAVIDTHIGDNQNEIVVDGHEYRGSWYGDDPNHPWGSIGNRQSFWFVGDSLVEAILNAGWSNARWIPGKGWRGERADRAWLVAE